MAFHVDAGALNKRVQFQKFEPGLDENGYQTKEGWKPKFECWASVQPVSAREFWQAESVHAELSHKVIIRFRSDVTADMRIEYSGRTLEICAPPTDPMEDHRYLTLKCREVTT